MIVIAIAVVALAFCCSLVIDVVVVLDVVVCCYCCCYCCCCYSVVILCVVYAECCGADLSSTVTGIRGGCLVKSLASAKHNTRLTISFETLES